MGMFNFDIKTILRDRARDLKNNYDYPGNVDITTIGGIRNTAKAEFFTENNMPEGNLRPEVMMLDENFREFFMTAFPLHYFNDEIGLETLPLFKVALSAKIYENAGYMNSIFESLDKQALHSYRVHRVDSNGSYNDTKVDTDNISRNVNASQTGTINSNGIETGTVEDNGSNTGTVGNVKANTGTVAIAGTNTGTVTTVGEKNDVNELHKTGTDNLVTNSSETGTRSESDTYTDNTTSAGTKQSGESGSESSTETGTSEKSGESTRTTQLTNVTSGGYTDTNSGTDTTAVEGENNYNGTVVSSDTPQGSLNNIRGSAVRKGDGIDAGAGGGATFNYMSAAQMNDNTSTEDTKTTVEHGLTTQRSYDGYTVEESGTEGNVYTEIVNSSKDVSSEYEKSYDEQTNGTENKTHQGNVNGNDSKSLNRADNRTLDLTDRANNESHDTSTRTDALENTSTETRNLNESDTETRNLTNVNTQTKDLLNTNTETRNLVDNTTDSTNRQGNENASGTNNSVMQETDNMYSLEFLAMSEPFMNKIWDIFDDIFMQVIDVWP